MATHRLFVLCMLAAAATAGCRSAELGAASPLATLETGFGNASRPVGVGGALQVAATTDGHLADPAIARNPLDDQFLGVWAEAGADGLHLYARRFDGQLRALNVPDSAESRIDLGGWVADAGAPAVAFDGQGYVVVWGDRRPDAPGVYWQRLDRSGRPSGDAARLSGASGASPALAETAVSGALLAAWQEDGRVMAAFVAGNGVGQAQVLADRAPGLFGLGGGPRHDAPVVASAPDAGRFLVAWRTGNALDAVTVQASGALGAVSALGEGAAPSLAYDPADRRFVALYQAGEQVVARPVSLDGAPAALVSLGAGEAPRVSWNPDARAYQALWTSRRYLVRQRLDGAAQPLGLAALTPSAGARNLAMVYDELRKDHLFTCEERAYGFERLTALKLPAAP